MGLIPKNEKREIGCIEKKRIWLYGDNGSGKSYLANTFPDALFINTDGNYIFVDSPAIHIRSVNEGHVEKGGWQMFKEVVDELATHKNTFRTIVVEQIEDIYAFARAKVLKDYGWKHEDDAGGFGTGYKLVDDEFFPVFDKLLSLDYENIILISHRKEGSEKDDDNREVKVFDPNIRPGIRSKIGGRMHFVGHVKKTGSWPGIIEIGKSERDYFVGRLGFKGNAIPATYEAICGLYDIGTSDDAKPAQVEPVEVEDVQVEPVELEPVESVVETPEKPKRRKVKRKDDGE